jgi:peptidoglycan/LPS O-acetylase OafA/YrhL
MPNLIPDWLPWMRPAGRLIWGVSLLIVGLLIVAVLMRRPKPDRPATWAECMAGAVGVFALMTLAFAVVPHEWITFADKYLQWGTTKFLVHSGQKVLFFKFPFDINYKAISDIIATGIYIVGFGGALALFAMWQKRGQAKADAEEPKPRTSRFGRPLRRRTPEPAMASSAGAATNGGDA